jgi:tetratricopeptide (TPR) repeat protein
VPEQRASGAAYAQALADKYGTQTFEIAPDGTRRPRRNTRAMLLSSVALFVVLAGALAGWAVFSRAQRARMETIDRLLKEVQELVSRDSFGAYREAADRCRQILEEDGGSLPGHAFLAYVDVLRATEHGEGEAVLREAAAQADAARRLGRHGHLLAAEAYLRAAGADSAGAITSLVNLVENDPAAQNALLMGTLGVLEMNAGDLDKAREWLARAQKANPNDVRVVQQLAEQYRRRGEGYELQADASYQLALRLQKDHVASLLGRAMLLSDRGAFDEALRLVQQALSSGDASPRQEALGRAVRGGILTAQGKTEEGAADERRALELDPQSPDLPWLVGRRQLRDGDAAAAVESIQRAVNGDPRRIAFYVDLTRALLATRGGSAKAVAVLQRAGARAGDHPRLALLLGDAYRAEGDLDRARGQYQRAIQLGKPFPDARVALARLSRAERDVPAALAELDLAITEYGPGGSGGAAQAYVEMAETERSRGARAEVVRGLFEKALSRDPASCEALWGAGVPAAGRAPDEAERARLQLYQKVCPAGAHVDEARRLAGSK